MNVETQLRTQIKKNDRHFCIVEADDLIAAWRYQKENRFKRSVDFSKVPTQYRCSAPPAEDCQMLPCHVNMPCKPGHPPMILEPACQSGVTAVFHSAHGAGAMGITSLGALDTVSFAKRNVAPYVSPILDTITLARVLKELGITGKAVPKVIRGRQYIALSGYAGLRSYLTGTTYSYNNRKIIQMAIGSLGIKNMVYGGARLTIYLTVPLTILECFLKDSMTMSQLIGNVTSDIIKIGASAIVGAIAGLMAGKICVLAAAPIIAAIGVSFITGWALQSIDDHLGLTNSLVAIIEQCSRELINKKESLKNELGDKIYEAEREIVFRFFRFDINNPLRRPH